MKALKCNKCGKTVKDKTIIKHMWSAHRAHMMKNHVGGFKTKKQAKAVSAKDTKRATALAPLQELVSLREAAKSAKETPRLSYQANGKPLGVVIYQHDGRSIAIRDVTLVEVFE